MFRNRKIKNEKEVIDRLKITKESLEKDIKSLEIKKEELEKKITELNENIRIIDGNLKDRERLINERDVARSNYFEKRCVDEDDPLLEESIQCVIETGQASTSFIQRKFKVGYARAGRIIDQMENKGVISGYHGSKPREVLISAEQWNELKKNNG